MTPFDKPVNRPPQDLSVALVNMCRRLFLGLFMLTCGLVGANLLFPLHLTERVSGGLEAFLVFFATTTTLFSLSRQLPGQNVLLGAAIIALIGSAVHAIGINTSIPFGPLEFSAEVKPQIRGVPWLIPFLWVVAVLNSRGVARLILRPWRKLHTYGWWLIGLTVVLCLLLDLGWEVFAARVKHYLFWSETKFPFTWHGVPLVNFLGWIVTSLLILAFATPALINKRPIKSIPDYHPLIVWLLLNALFLTGAAVNQLWSAVILTGVASVPVTIFALRGARW